MPARHRRVSNDTFLPAKHSSYAALPLRALQHRPRHGARHHVAHQALDRLPQPGILVTEGCLSLLYVLLFLHMECYFANFVQLIKVDPPSTATGHAIAILSDKSCCESDEFHFNVYIL